MGEPHYNPEMIEQATTTRTRWCRRRATRAAGDAWISAAGRIVGLTLFSLLLFGRCEAWPVAAQDLGAELPRLPPTQPDQALTTFELADGLQIELLAAEPLVVDPVAIAWDEFGRTFVVEMRGYSEQANAGISRVRSLVDQDGDGRFDHATTFVDGLRWPTAVACLRGGVLVADAPDLLYFRDRDGDGTADDRAVLWTGFGTQNVQQLLNNLQWGLDQKLYLATGGNGGTLTRGPADPLGKLGWTVQETNAPSLEVGGRDLILDPETLELQPASGGGQFGMTFDRWGNRYVCSNSDHCQQIVIEDRYLARNPLLRVPSARVSIAADGPAAEVFRLSPIEPWRMVRTRLRVQGLAPGPIEGGGRAGGYFTSATGITAYDGDILPPEYVDSIFIGDVGSNLVHRKRLIDHGIVKSAVRVDQQSEFLRSRDNWFRPVQCAVGPDGSLFVLDMYRENVEHPASLPPEIKRHLDLNSGNDRGRIYRVVPRGYRPEPRALPGNATREQLVAMLEHPNGWQRATAARLIRERWDDAFAAQIRARGLNSSRAEARIRAMYLLAADPRTEWAELDQLTFDEEPYVRAQAARIAEQYLPDSLRDLQCSAVDDPDERVGFQVALALGGSTQPDQAAVATDALAELAKRSENSEWMALAITSSAASCRSRLFVSLVSTSDGLGEGPLQKQLVRELLREIARSNDRRELQLVAVVLQVASQENIPAVGGWLAALAAGDAAQRGRVEKAFGELTFHALRANVVRSAGRVIRDPPSSIAAQVDALYVLQLADPEEFAELIPDLLAVHRPPEIRDATLNTLATFEAETIGRALARQLPALGPEDRNRGCHLLAARSGWTALLLEGIESRRLSPVLVDATVRQQLVRSQDPAIAARSQQVFGTGTRADRAAVIAEYAAAMQNLAGDIDRGRTIFRKTCAACHRLEQVGEDVGKSLAAAANQGESALLQNILDPNREVDARYLAYVLVTADGRSLSGVIASESASSVTLRTADGQTVTVARDEIESIRSTTLSLMPENLENDLPPQAMADLLAYLMSERE